MGMEKESIITSTVHSHKREERTPAVRSSFLFCVTGAYDLYFHNGLRLLIHGMF